MARKRGFPLWGVPHLKKKKKKKKDVFSVTNFKKDWFGKCVWSFLQVGCCCLAHPCANQVAHSFSLAISFIWITHMCCRLNTSIDMEKWWFFKIQWWSHQFQYCHCSFSIHRFKLFEFIHRFSCLLSSHCIDDQSMYIKNNCFKSLLGWPWVYIVVTPKKQ